MIQAHYPLDQDDLLAIEECRSEYAVLDDHALPQRVKRGGRANAYHVEILEGRNPDDDLELVEVQLRYASDYFMCSAEMTALALLLGTELYAKIEDKLIAATRWTTSGWSSLPPGRQAGFTLRLCGRTSPRTHRGRLARW